jgi:micrococcal nuclease
MLEIIAAYVIDGDTLAVGPTRIRLWGIDAPEINSRAGRRARRSLADLVAQGTWYCDPRSTDRYGRVVAQCTDAQGRDLACILVAQGNAQDWPRFSGGYYRQCAGR